MSFDLEQAALPPDASRTPIPQYYLSLSKRICAVARPIWLASLRPDEENTANYLNRALSIDGATDCIRSVDLAVATHEPAIYLALLAQLPRLESLALDFELLNTAEESLVVAKALTRFLRRSSHLKSLTLTRPTTHDDPDLILDRDVPTLRTLRTSGGAWTDGVLLRGACNLRFLDYRSANMAELVIPTYTLRRLRIAPSAYVESSPSFPRAFRRAFHVPEADFPKTALRQLSLGFAVLNDHESDSFSSQHFLELLESLARSGIDTLEIGSAGIITLPERLLVEFAIPVKTLVIRGPLKLQVNLAPLSNVVNLFGHLNALYLNGSVVSEAYPRSRALAALSLGDLAIKVPHLVAFLAFLRSATQVTDFRYRGENDMKEVRWSRSSLEADFVGECWTL